MVKTLDCRIIELNSWYYVQLGKLWSVLYSYLCVKLKYCYYSKRMALVLTTFEGWYAIKRKWLKKKLIHITIIHKTNIIHGHIKPIEQQKQIKLISYTKFKTLNSIVKNNTHSYKTSLTKPMQSMNLHAHFGKQDCQTTMTHFPWLSCHHSDTGTIKHFLMTKQ